MASLAEIALLSGQQQADSLRRLSDIESQRRSQRSALWANTGINLANLAANTYLSSRDQQQRQKEFTVATERQSRLDDEAMRSRLQARGDRLIEQQRQDVEAEQIKTARAAFSIGADGKMRLGPGAQQALQAQGRLDLLPGIMDSIAKHNSTLGAQAQAATVKAMERGYNVAQRGFQRDDFVQFMGELQASGQVPQDILLQLSRSNPQTPEQVEKALRPWLELSEVYGDQFKLQKVGDDFYDPWHKKFIVNPGAAPKTDLGSFPDYVAKRFGPNATAEQIEIARAKYADLGRDPTPGPQTSTGLPARTEAQVYSKARIFGTEPIVRRAQTMAEAVQFLNSLDPSSTNPADDISLIYAFAKVMDPESVVREGEYATVQRRAQSWAASIGLDARNVLTGGEFLTDKARAQMKATIAQKFEASRKGYDNLAEKYAASINKMTGRTDGADYLIDYAGAFPERPGGAAAPPKAGDEISGDVDVYSGNPGTPAAGKFFGTINGTPVEVHKVNGKWVRK